MLDRKCMMALFSGGRAGSEPSHCYGASSRGACRLALAAWLLAVLCTGPAAGLRLAPSCASSIHATATRAAPEMPPRVIEAQRFLAQRG